MAIPWGEARCQRDKGQRANDDAAPRSTSPSSHPFENRTVTVSTPISGILIVVVFPSLASISIKSIGAISWISSPTTAMTSSTNESMSRCGENRYY